jgi:protein phosphatase
MTDSSGLPRRYAPRNDEDRQSSTGTQQSSIPRNDSDPNTLRISDVLGKRTVQTALMGRLSIQAEQSAGALEAMSRFAVDPRWLVYLPPTMIPVATSQVEGFLEHPREAFSYFREEGVDQVICEEKHMGSRSVTLVTRTAEIAEKLLGTPAGQNGVIHTRTGRAFFNAELNAEALTRIGAAVEKAGLWEELKADWLLIDAEILPWSLKAGPMIRYQYAPVAASGLTMLQAVESGLQQGIERGLDLADDLDWAKTWETGVASYAEVIGRYAWPVDELNGVKIAPFQLLASSAGTLYDRDHLWQMAAADRLVAADPEFFQHTRRLLVEVNDEANIQQAVDWWTELTATGGEGMVVKPLHAPVKGKHGLVPPGLKVRGRDYLRITYGPTYTEPENLAKLRNRRLGPKRSRALREYALGLEAIDRFTRGEPLWRIHEAVFAVLALEADPEDPRL